MHSADGSRFDPGGQLLQFPEPLYLGAMLSIAYSITLGRSGTSNIYPTGLPLTYHRLSEIILSATLKPRGNTVLK